MMDAKEYRIVERVGKFPRYGLGIRYMMNQILEPFDTLSEAREYVKLILKGDKIHKI